MSKKTITELDFDQIKDNLKDFLRSQSQFNDYDFEASGLAILIDLLSYNTHYNSFYTNMVGAEMFLDTAQLRESVVSKAKHLAYIPRSTNSARASINITFNTPGSVSNITIPKGTAFTGRGSDSSTYTFTSTETKVVYPNSSGEFKVEDLVIIEGTRLIHSFDVDYSGPSESRYILPNANVDTSYILVTVQSNSSAPSVFHKRVEDINLVQPDDNVFYLQEIEGGLYEIYFGDDIIGKKPTDGSIVNVEYVVSNGISGNDISVFAPANGVAGYSSSTLTIETTSNSSGGALPESLDSIRLLAPLNWEAQDRAVTVNDYEYLIKSDNPEIEFARVWGGEDNDPPQYGRVFVSLKPIGGVQLSKSQKDYIINTVIRKRNLISMEVVLVEPDYTYIITDTTVRYLSSLTNDTAGTIKQTAINAIKSYRTNSLAGFNKLFRYSKLSNTIDESDDSILNSLSEVTMKAKILPALNVPTQYTISFNNQIDKGDSQNNESTLSSSAFTYKGVTSYLGDDGNGGIYIYRMYASTKVIFETGVGTINYDTGKITLRNFTPEALPSGETIDIIVKPELNDLISQRNQVFLIEDEDISVTVIDETTGVTS